MSLIDLLAAESHAAASTLIRLRRKLDRQQAAVEDTLRQRDELIRQAVAAGASVSKVAKIAGLTVGRVSQIAKESTND